MREKGGKERRKKGKKKVGKEGKEGRRKEWEIECESVNHLSYFLDFTGRVKSISFIKIF